MYRILIFFIFSFLTVNSLQAQNPFVGKDSLKVNDITYHCWSDFGWLHIGNKQNLSEQETFVLPYAKEPCNYASPNEALIESTINNALTANRRNALRGTGVKIIFYVKPLTGIIQEVRFVISGDCTITGQEIYALEQHLKGKQMNPQPACGSVLFTPFAVRL